jgi:hypothetical protein
MAPAVLRRTMLGNVEWDLRRAVPLAAALVVLGAPSAAHAVTPFGKLTCGDPQDGVRFCQGDGAAKRVATPNGGFLDVDVALPATGDTNLPLVVQLHGWGGSKSGLDAMKPWAQKGYAVLNYSARGFGKSCGSPDSRLALECASGWIHLADTRYEVRDTQELAGILADEGIVDPQRIGATGGSYGGGQSMALAVLRDRVMNPDGSLAPWKSPNGKAMRIAAAAPTIPWTDLVYSLLPNGRTLDYAITGPQDDRTPVGVEKQSFVSGLFASGAASGFYAPPGLPDSSNADLTQWFALTNAGEPYAANPQTTSVVNEIAEHHSSYYLDDSVDPAPLFISNGFTDDLFPPDEALRFYNRTRLEHPATPLKLMFFDFGHMRGQAKPDGTARLRAAIEAWFDHYVKGTGPAPAQDVAALTQTCPKAAASGGPFTAPTWDSIHPGEVRGRFAGEKTIQSTGSDPQVSAAVDPIAGGGACAQTSSSDISGVATYRLDKVTGPGYTLLGSPLVSGRFAVTGAGAENTQIAARLWDVAPGGQQTLVARGVYRPRGEGAEAFQLHANGWRFAAGHTPKLELLGQDSPYARASNGAFSTTASDVELRLPVADEPGSAPGVTSPSALPLPRGAHLAPGVVRLSLRLRYRKPRRARACWTSVAARVGGQGLSNLRRVDFVVGRKRVKRDTTRAFAATITRVAARRARSRTLRVRALRRDGRTVTMKKRLRAC